MDRRTFTKVIVSAALAAPICSEAQEIEDSDFEFTSELEALSNASLRAEVNTRGAYFDFASLPDLADEVKRNAVVQAAIADRSRYARLADADLPRWPTVAHAPDYAGLADATAKSTPFTLTAQSLKWLCERNRFQILDQDGSGIYADRVIFGLRGCALANGASKASWRDSHALIEITPDHRTTKCLLGIWRKADNKIAIYRGSTVPVGDEMFMSLAHQGAGSALLPTGLYRYRRGTHKKSAALSRQQPNALIIADNYVVLRTAERLVYDPYAKTTVWTRGDRHNIHASGSTASLDRFHSAGCQVVCGYYRTEGTGRIPTGNWAAFQADARLAGPEQSGQDVIYQYFVLTGREAAMAGAPTQEVLANYWRLRPGSSGEAVAELQRKFDVAAGTGTPYFGMKTTFAVLDACKRSLGEYATHVYSEALFG